MIRLLAVTLFCILFARPLSAEEKAPRAWTHDRLIAHIQSVAEKLQSEYVAEKEKDAGDLDMWNQLEYYANKLRDRLFVKSREATLSSQKSRDLKWLARESEIRAYNMRSREAAAKQLKELKVLLAEIKEQLKTNDELPRGAAFQLKALAAEERMRPMQLMWTPPKGEEVDE